MAKLFFAYGLGNGLYFPLATGGTTVLLPDRPVPEKVFEVIDRYQPTVFYSVPTSYAALLHQAEKTGRTSLGRVRMCVSAGETLPQHIFLRWRERFGVEILDGIGSTEILHIFISNRPGQAKAGSTGQIVPGYEARIVDDDGHDLPAGQVGTLLIKGDSIAAGYWNKHAATKQTFCGEWINTHDKFMVDQDGYFWYAGRTDDMMKVSGQAVWPTEVEGILQGHPAVLESGVTGAADEDGLLKPVAYVVLKDGHEPSPELARELQEFVKRNTAPHKYPRAVVFVETLPKTATGKIKRFELRERAAVDGVLHPQQRRAPDEPGAEGHQQHQAARADHPRLPGLVEGDRQRGRGDVAVVFDVHEDLLPRNADALDDRLQHPQVGLVRHEHVDLVERQAVDLEGLEHRLRHLLHAVLEDGLAVHAEVDAAGVDVVLGDVLLAAQAAAGGGRVEGLGVPAVGVEDGREDAADRRPPPGPTTTAPAPSPSRMAMLRPS